MTQLIGEGKGIFLNRLKALQRDVLCQTLFRALLLLLTVDCYAVQTDSLNASVDITPVETRIDSPLSGKVLVTGLTLKTQKDGSTEIVLALSHRTKYTLFTLASPDRIVVDLKNAIGHDFIKQQRLNNDLVARVRSSQRTKNILRVVLDLHVPADVEDTYLAPDKSAGHRLVIHARAADKGQTKSVGTNDPASNSLTSVAAKATLTKKNGVINAQPGVTMVVPIFIEQKRKLNINQKAPVGLVHVRGATLESIADGDDQLVLSLDGPVDHNIFMLAEPDRIVIDLEETIGDSYINGQRLQNGLVQLIRAGAHDGNRLRIVLDLAGPAYAESQLLSPDDKSLYKLAIKIHHIPQPEEKQIQEGPQLTKEPATRGMVPHTDDRIQLGLNYQKAPLGSIDAIEHSSGYMLPLSQLFQILDFAINVHVDEGLAEGWFIRPNRIFVLDVSKGEAIIAGNEKTFPVELVQIRHHDIYVDSSLLSRLFPILFLIDPAVLSLTLKPKPKMPEEERTEMVNQWLTVNGIKTKSPMPVSASKPIAAGEKAEVHVIEKGKEVSPPKTVEEEVLPPSPDRIQEIPEAVLAELSEEDLIVLQPIIDNIPIEDFIETYQLGERHLLPLQALSDILHFMITVDAPSGQAVGWYLSEEQTFTLDLAGQQVMLAGVQHTIPDHRLHATDTELFIDSSLLSQWFPLDFEVDLQKLSLDIFPRVPLPFQIREQRLKDWNRLQSSRKVEESYEIVTTPYSLASMPFMDLNLEQGYSNQGEDKFTSNYSLRGSGDLGYLSTNIFASGNSSGETLGSLRINSGRKSDYANLLGPLKATQFLIGDINSITIPLVAQSSLGRGFSVSNRPLFQSDEFDSTNFIGDALPDWEVELYRNGALIDFQVIGSDGRYEFLNVPILYGNNTFQLLFHGPQGQVREEVRRFNIGSSFLKKGTLNYEFSLDEKSKPLIDVGDSEIINHPEEVRIAGELEYGLMDSLTGTLGMISTPLKDGEHRYFTAGLRTSFAGVLGNLDSAYDQTNGGWATKLSAFGSIRNVSVKVEHRLFNNFFSEEKNNFNSPLDSQTEFDLNGTFSLPYFNDFNVNLNFKREKLESGESRIIIRNRLAKSLLGMRYTNTLEKTLFQGTDLTRGEFSLRGHFYGALLRMMLSYTIKPEREVDRLEVIAQRKISRDMLVRIALTKSLGDNQSTTFSGSLNWDRKRYKLSLFTDFDSENKISFGVNVIFSLGRIPDTGNWRLQSKSMASRGGLSARAYLDRNFNDLFDEEDEIIENASFNINGEKVLSDNGVALSTGLLVDRYSNITIDPEGLEDPLWIPSIDGYKVFPRPGVITSLDFPVVEASEVDGTVYLIDDAGNKRSLSRIGVQLVNASSGEVAIQFMSEFDGFYLMENVHAGAYIIRIREQDLKRLNLVQEQELELNITGKSDIYSGYDIRLAKIKKLAQKQGEQ